MDLMRQLGRGRRTMAVWAMLVASLAFGPFRIGLGQSLAERGGLTLAAASGLVEFGTQKVLAAFPVAQPISRR